MGDGRVMQQWFNLAGLCFDFLGVMMLAYEWWIALSADRQEAERAAFERRIQPPPMMRQQQQQSNPHQPMHDYMRENLRFQQQIQREQGIRGMRRGWFTAAMVFVALGFLLQIVGSWPGGF
jgi:hypothetical protein